jgi:hypothetical protein
MVEAMRRTTLAELIDFASRPASAATASAPIQLVTING